MLRYIFIFIVTVAMAMPAIADEVSITIDISSQSMRVAVGGVPTYSFDVSTGRKGYATPRGTYGVTRMYKRYYSKKYDGAPMPYSIFFRGGYAIHGTTDIKRLGRVASHGCVRLHPESAKKLFYLVKENGAGNVSIRVKG